MKKNTLVNGLYCITDNIEDIEKICRGKADIVQLRLKNISDRDFFYIGKKAIKIVRKYNVLFLINDRLDIALLIGADGVHLGQEDLPLKEIKNTKLKIKNFIIGISTHNLTQAKEAEKDAATYISFGPIFNSPTKPELKPVGLELLKEVKKKVKIPVVAIGGINEENICEVKKTGVDSVAVISAITKAKDIESNIRNLKRMLNIYRISRQGW